MSLNTLSSLIDVSSSLQMASHLGSSGAAMASVNVQGSSRLVTLTPEGRPHSNLSLHSCSIMSAVWRSNNLSIVWRAVSVRSLSLSARGDIANLGSESGGAGEGLFVVVLDLCPLCPKSMQGLL